jgi:SSS family solute:Na+ symporter
MHASAVVVFVVLFALVTALGFYAIYWWKGDLSSLPEWGLAGRRFGALVSWFLLGGDLYTAYTFIAVPGLAYGTGALAFFAVPYSVLIYPILFTVFPRFWSVAKAKGYVTAADYVQGRFESRGMALAVAFTGILATMPYIALQLVGMQAALQTLGLTGKGFVGANLALVVAFATLAVYTYVSGLRAPAMVAVVKDALIYITVIVAVVAIPAALGGFGHIFHAAAARLAALPKPGSVLLSPKLYTAYATLALGSALALFFYPHAVTAVFAARSRQAIRRNAAFLPLYSLLLGFIALLGLMALAAGVRVPGGNTNLAVPLLFERMFPQWFVGFALAAIFVGALVPASVMSIAAASLFTRNVYREYFAPRLTEEQEARIAKLVSLVVKLGALVFVVGIPVQFSLYLQTLGGIWILQTVPMILGGLYTRWLHRGALLVGWAVGMVLGTAMAASVGFKSSFYALFGHTLGYSGIWALAANAVVAVALSAVLQALRVANGRDATAPADYGFEATASEVALG